MSIPLYTVEYYRQGDTKHIFSVNVFNLGAHNLLDKIQKDKDPKAVRIIYIYRHPYKQEME